MFRLVLTLLVALLGAASPAQASRHRPHRVHALREAPGWRIERAKAVAAKAWGNPCPGGVSVSTAHIAEDRGAEATMSTCHITFQADVSRTWADLCLLTLHEYGHLAGFTDPLNPADPYHSHDPASFMSADLGNGNLVDADYGRVHVFKGYDRRCAYHGRPYLGLSHRGMQREVWR